MSAEVNQRKCAYEAACTPAPPSCRPSSSPVCALSSVHIIAKRSMAILDIKAAHPHVVVEFLVILNERLEVGTVCQHVLAHPLPYELVVTSGALHVRLGRVTRPGVIAGDDES